MSNSTTKKSQRSTATNATTTQNANNRFARQTSAPQPPAQPQQFTQTFTLNHGLQGQFGQPTLIAYAPSTPVGNTVRPTMVATGMPTTAAGLPATLAVPVHQLAPGQQLYHVVMAPRKIGSQGKISSEELQYIQMQIEQCLHCYMDLNEIVTTLHTQANIEPTYTNLVWQCLEQQNQEFFKAYNIRLRIKEQITAFNYLVSLQAHLFPKPIQIQQSMPIAGQNTSTFQTQFVGGVHQLYQTGVTYSVASPSLAVPRSASSVQLPAPMQFATQILPTTATTAAPNIATIIATNPSSTVATPLNAVNATQQLIVNTCPAEPVAIDQSQQPSQSQSRQQQQQLQQQQQQQQQLQQQQLQQQLQQLPPAPLPAPPLEEIRRISDENEENQCAMDDDTDLQSFLSLDTNQFFEL